MRKEILLVFTGAILFNIIFWQEKLALNAVLFDAFLVSTIFYLYPEAKDRTITRWLLLAHLVTLAMVVIHNSDVSKVAFVISLVLFASFAEYVHRSPWFAAGSFLMNVVLLPASIVEKWQTGKVKANKRRSIERILRFSIVPLLLVFVFFIIYRVSNSVFSEMAYELSLQVERFFTTAFSWFSVTRGLFLALGFYLVGSLILKARTNYFGRAEAGHNDALLRKSKHMRERKTTLGYEVAVGFFGRFASGIMALKNENTVGIISLVMLNILLLFVNVIDINYIWLHSEFSRNSNLYKTVHEGAESLIVSIVLAMVVLVFFFKGNLNFYKKNKWLKLGAYAWIFQNLILVISVFLRDYYYIAYFGLAYKRIGVLFFLFAVLAGLTTVFIKISCKKSNYFLFRVNAWVGICMLVAATTISWDRMIAEYNFKNNSKVPVDLDFIFTLSDETLPVIDQNKEILVEREVYLRKKQEQLKAEESCNACYREMLAKRKFAFINRQQSYSWLSWNYSDAEVKSYITGSTENISQHKSH